MRVFLCLGLLALAPQACAEEAKFDAAGRAAALAPLIEEETFALVRIDATRCDVEGLLTTLRALLPAHKDDFADYAKTAKEFRAAFIGAGGGELVVAFSTEDMPAPSFVRVPLKQGANVAALTRLLKEAFGPNATVEKRGDALVAGSANALSRLARGKPSARAELLPAVTAAGDAAVTVLLLPTDDQRRVIDEVIDLPALGGSGKALTRGCAGRRWVSTSAQSRGSN